MWGHHLKRRGRWWHYFRSVPERFRDVEARREICFSLRTQNFAEAKVKASQIFVDLDKEWQRSDLLGVSLKSNSAATRYTAVVQAQVDRSFAPKSANEFKDEELLARLRALMSGPTQPSEQKAVLGLSEKPKLSVMGAFERF